MKNADTKLNIILVIMTALLLVVIIFSIIALKNWNHGVCPKCHKEYEIISRFTKGGTSYIKFKCSECGNDGIVPEWVK